MSAIARLATLQASRASTRYEIGCAAFDQFVGREGHANAPLLHEEETFSLWQWCGKLRTANKNGVISGETVAKFSAIPGWMWNPADVPLPPANRSNRQLVGEPHPGFRTHGGYDFKQPLTSSTRDARVGYRLHRLDRILQVMDARPATSRLQSRPHQPTSSPGGNATYGASMGSPFGMGPASLCHRSVLLDGLVSLFLGRRSG